MRVAYPAGGWLPPGTVVNWQRDDQGKDFVIPWRGVLQAPGSGVCITNGSDHPFPNGFGPSYAMVRIDTGRFAGHGWYIGHCTSLVSPGERFTFGHPLARADQGHDFEGTVGGWVELGERLPSGQLGPFSGSHWFDSLLKSPLVISVPDPPLGLGSKGARVLQFTRWLWQEGWLQRPYWHFNSIVHDVVVSFQKRHKLVTDGIVGPRTWGAIYGLRNRRHRP